jgi:hypothetical protein
VGENFGGGLFSTSPENLVTYFDRAEPTRGLELFQPLRGQRFPWKNKVFSEICILEETLDLNFQKLIELASDRRDLLPLARTGPIRQQKQSSRTSN